MQISYVVIRFTVILYLDLEAAILLFFLLSHYAAFCDAVHGNSSADEPNSSAILNNVVQNDGYLKIFHKLIFSLA